MIVEKKSFTDNIPIISEFHPLIDIEGQYIYHIQKWGIYKISFIRYCKPIRTLITKKTFHEKN